MLNKTNWTNCQIQSQGVEKINFIKKQLNDIHKNSIALTEFSERLHLKDEMGYEYISGILKSWEQVTERLNIARNFVFRLPINLEMASRREKILRNIAETEKSLQSRTKESVCISKKLNFLVS